MLYPVLPRLEREGLIVSRWSQSEEGGQALSTEREQWLSVHNTLAALWGIQPCPT